MNILAILGTYRKGKTIDTLVDKAIEGAQSRGASVEKVRLIERHIEYCRNCMVCKNNPEPTVAPCPIKDDMQELLLKMDAADGYILACPVNMGQVTAVTKTFLERTCWALARPGRQYFLKGCPVPRNPRRKRAIIIVSAGLIPPWLRWLCDDATKLFKSMCESSYNAKVVGHMYAGDIQHRGVAPYLEPAYRLGRRLVP